jgi:hypothetical protein
MQLPKYKQYVAKGIIYSTVPLTESSGTVVKSSDVYSMCCVTQIREELLESRI